MLALLLALRPKWGVLINVVAPQTNLSRSCKVLVKSVGKGFQGSIAQVKGFQIETNRLASPPLKTNCGPHMAAQHRAYQHQDPQTT